MTDSSDERGSVSRRSLLSGMALAAAGGAAALSHAALGADAQASGPMVKIDKTYRALVRRTNQGPSQIEKVKLLPFGGRQVLVRNTAEHCCYSDVLHVLGPITQASGKAAQDLPRVLGHAGLGVVEAIGPAVRGLRPGDKVFISVTSHCGACYNCVRGRADKCLADRLSPGPIAETMDGIPVGSTKGIGGLAEYSVCYEERLTPYFSSSPDEEVALLACSGSTGLGMTTTLRPLEAGSSVVIFGCGPVGLSAVQGARIQGATKIIAVEPIAARRELALKLGATDAVDPNLYESDKLLNHLRELTLGTTDRILIGGRHDGRVGNTGRTPNGGPNYVIEAVGAQHYPPKVESARDPTGIQALEQVFDLIPRSGWGMTCGAGYPPDAEVSLSAQMFTNGAKTLCSCQGGGTQSRRDLPRFVSLLDQGKFDARSVISNVYKFDDVLQAFQEVADRTVVANVITFT